MYMLSVFIGRVKKNQEDQICVSSDDGILFTLSYADVSSGVRQVLKTDKNGIVEYFDNLFVIIQMDDEPFHCIQIDFPAYPTILLNIASLQDYKIHQILKILRNSLDNTIMKQNKITNAIAFQV